MSATGADFIEWSWNATPGATAYAVQVSEDETFTVEDQLALSIPTNYAVPVGPGTTRYLRVAAALVTDPENPLNPETTLLSAWTTPVTGTSAEPPPEPKPPASPTGLMVSATGEDFIEWRWNGVEGANAYAVQVSPDEAFTEADPITAVRATTHRESDLEPGAERYLRVAAALVTDPENPLNPETTLLSAWTTHVTGTSAEPPPEPKPPATPTGLMVSATGEDFIEWRWNGVEGANAYAVQVSPDEAFTEADPITAVRATTHRESGLEPGAERYLRVAAAVVSDPRNPLHAETTLLSAWTTPRAGVSGPPPAPSGLAVSATGADFIEWSWPEGTLAHEIQWAFRENRIGRRDAIRTVASRYRLRVEPGTTAWLRLRTVEGAAAPASEWSPALAGSSDAASCVLPEVSASRPREGSVWHSVRNEITIERPADARRPLVRIRRPYWAADDPLEPFLAARLLSWTTTPGGGLVRDRLSFDWPHSSELRDFWEGAGGLAPALDLEIAAPGCRETVTVVCTSFRCALRP